MEKITKKDKFKMLLDIEEVKNNIMLVDFINHEIELNSNKKRANKTMIELNQKIAEMVYNALAKLNKPATISEILDNKEIKEFTYTEGKETKKLSNQKINFILQGLAKDNKVINTKDKKKSYYAIVKE